VNVLAVSRSTRADVMPHGLPTDLPASLADRHLRDDLNVSRLDRDTYRPGSRGVLIERVLHRV
jgi:hypothetical protein